MGWAGFPKPVVGVAVALAGVSVLATACSSDADQHETGPSSQAASNHPSVATSTNPVINMTRDPQYGMDSLLMGRLRLEDDCLTIRRHPVLWPTYVRWNERDQSVRSTHRNVTLHLGERVRLGGGGMWVRDLESFISREAYSRLIECASRAERAKVLVVDNLLRG